VLEKGPMTISTLFSQASTPYQCQYQI